MPMMVDEMKDGEEDKANNSTKQRSNKKKKDKYSSYIHSQSFTSISNRTHAINLSVQAVKEMEIDR